MRARGLSEKVDPQLRHGAEENATEVCTWRFAEGIVPSSGNLRFVIKTVGGKSPGSEQLPPLIWCEVRLYFPYANDFP